MGTFNDSRCSKIADKISSTEIRCEDPDNHISIFTPGISCDMDAIMSIAKTHNLFVIEDNAHGIYGTYKGRMLGTIGHLGALSFHYTKNLVCGEGGAVLINDTKLISPAMIAWEKGTNRCLFLLMQCEQG